MAPRQSHSPARVPEEESDLPVEPDEGQVPATGVPADPEFERIVNPPD